MITQQRTFNRENDGYDGVLYAGEEIHQTLKDARIASTWRLYEGIAHHVCPEEVEDMERFMRERLAPATTTAEQRAKSKL